MALKPMMNFLPPSFEQGSVHSLIVDDMTPHDEVVGRSMEQEAFSGVRFDSQTRQDEATVNNVTVTVPAAVYMQSTLHNHQQEKDILVVAKENHEPSDAKAKIAAINKSVTNAKVSLLAAAPQQQMSSSPFPSPSRLGYTDSHPSERSTYASYASASASQTSNATALYHPQVLNAGCVDDTVLLDKKDDISVDEDHVSQIPKQASYTTTNLASLNLTQAEVSCTADGSPLKQKRVRWTKEEDDVLLKAVPSYTLRNRTKQVSWQRLVRKHFQGVRSSGACKNRYCKLTKSGLNQAPLTTDDSQAINQEQAFKESNIGARASDSLDSSVSEMNSDSDHEPSVQQQRKSHLWTEEEDMLLRKAVDKNTTRTHGKSDKINWKYLARAHFRGKLSAFQCKQRYERYVKPGLKLEPFTEEEDRIIVQGAEENKTWDEIAALLGGKRERVSIRERWIHKLDPELKSGPFTDEEKAILTQAQERLGNKWTKISKLLPGRSPSQVRTAWLSMKSAKSKQKSSQE